MDRVDTLQVRLASAALLAEGEVLRGAASAFGRPGFRDYLILGD